MHSKIKTIFHERYYSKSTRKATMILIFAMVITLTEANSSEIRRLRKLIGLSILKKIDFSANPCEDFYQFACGKFIEEAIIPDGSNSVGTFEEIEAKLEHQLSLIIPSGLKEDGPPVFKFMKHYYQTCTDTDEIEMNSEKDLREVLEKLGGCPSLEGQSWNEDKFDITTSMIESDKLGYSNDYFVRTSITVDPNDSSRHIINIDQPNSIIDHRILLTGKTNSIIQNHVQALIKIFEFLGIDKKVAEKELDSVVDLEIHLAKISLSRNERRNKSRLNNRMILEELVTSYDVIKWKKFLNEILAPYAEVDVTEEINVSVPRFLYRLPELILRTPKRVLANYVCVRTIWQSIDNMGERFLSIKVKDAKVYDPAIKNDKPRWKYCLYKTSQYFSTAVGWLYVKNYFDKNAKDSAVDLVENTREALMQYIVFSDWVDDVDKHNTIDKLKALVAHIGYPNEFDDDDGKINEPYQNLISLAENFFSSELTLKQFHKKQAYSSLRKPTNKTSWIDHGDVAKVNAYYTLQYNSFNLPAGILQGEFFNKDRPSYMNYAMTGSFVAHEMTHAFDNEGSQYDKDGNQANLFGKTSKERFSKITDCIIQQYNNYTVKEVDMKINGINTLNENFADNIGLIIAHRAYYEYWRIDTGLTEGRLPELEDFTPLQMFWISYANAWCAKFEPEYLKLALQSDVHSPPEFRVNGPLSNVPMFSQDFNCPVGSRMNPEKKCPLE